MRIKEQESRAEPLKLQAFSEYMADFLRRIRAKDVVEVGSDMQLRLATNLLFYCDRYYSVNLPKDTRVMKRGWNKLRKDLGFEFYLTKRQKVKLIGGNAVELSKLVPHADVIILHNVLLDLTGKDSALMWKYEKGEVEHTDEQWEELMLRFDQAEEQGYREFLKVANPGYIVTSVMPETSDRFMDFFVNTLRINQRNIERKICYYDNSEEKWEAFIINNTH